MIKSHYKMFDQTHIHQMHLIHLLSRIACILIFPIWLWHDMLALIQNDFTANQSFYPRTLIMLLILVGFTNFLQSVVAITVLSLVSPLTYSVANVAKKAAVIVISISLLHNRVSAANVIGISITIIGVIYYNKAKQEDLTNKLISHSKSDANIRVMEEQDTLVSTKIP